MKDASVSQNVAVVQNLAVVDVSIEPGRQVLLTFGMNMSFASTRPPYADLETLKTTKLQVTRTSQLDSVVNRFLL